MLLKETVNKSRGEKSVLKDDVFFPMSAQLQILKTNLKKH